MQMAWCRRCRPRSTSASLTGPVIGKNNDYYYSQYSYLLAARALRPRRGHRLPSQPTGVSSNLRPERLLYQQPGGLIEGSPGVFYGEASSGNGTQLVFSVTTQGSTSTLASFQANIESMLVSGSNGRYYSSVQPRGQLVTPFSVTSALGSQQVYSAQTFASSFSQNLPDGSLLGGAGWNGIDYVITLLSGYKSNRFNWLAKSSKSSRESDG
jgi:hypothetical protein